MNENRRPNTGWGFPDGSRKCHFFLEDGMALCRKYGFFFGPKSLDNGKTSPDDCSVCRKILDKQKKTPKRQSKRITNH